MESNLEAITTRGLDLRFTDAGRMRSERIVSESRRRGSRAGWPIALGTNTAHNVSLLRPDHPSRPMAGSISVVPLFEGL